MWSMFIPILFVRNGRLEAQTLMSLVKTHLRLSGMQSYKHYQIPKLWKLNNICILCNVYMHK